MGKQIKRRSKMSVFIRGSNLPPELAEYFEKVPDAVKDTWRINPEPSRIQHYAAFPTKLVRVILDLACPKRVCVKCGVPWERVVDKSERVRVREGSDTSGDAAAVSGHGKHGATSILATGEKAIVRTVGWRPGCECEAGFVPGIVLDPFAGSGTTLVVAKRLGFNYVGIELSEKYCCEMVRRRLADEIVSLELFGT